MNMFGAEAQDAPELRRRAFWMSFGLLYLIPVGVTVAHYDGPRRVLGFVALAAFVGVYVASSLVRRSWADPLTPAAWTLLGALAVLSAGLPLAFGREWMGLPIYLAIGCAMTLPIRWAPAGIVGAMVLAAAQGGILRAGWPMTAIITITLFSFGMMMLGFRHSRALVAELRAARGEVARLAAADERLRIARDLHDLLGHSLSLIVLKSELARRIAERDTGRAISEIGDIEEVARRSLTEVREAISGYRQRSLTEELDGARAVLSAAGIEAVVRTSGTPLPDAVDGLFGWAVREGVTNVVRHARATRCVITVLRDTGGASLEVRDDGRGGGHVPGNGLNGLTERITGAGGSLTAGPAGAGFLLAVRVPAAPVAGSAPVGSPS